MCRNYIYFSVKITHIYCYSITQKKCPAHVLPMYIFAVCSSTFLCHITVQIGDAKTKFYNLIPKQRTTEPLYSMNTIPFQISHYEILYSCTPSISFGL